MESSLEMSVCKESWYDTQSDRTTSTHCGAGQRQHTVPGQDNVNTLCQAGQRQHTVPGRTTSTHCARQDNVNTLCQAGQRQHTLWGRTTSTHHARQDNVNTTCGAEHHSFMATNNGSWTQQIQGWRTVPEQHAGISCLQCGAENTWSPRVPPRGKCRHCFLDQDKMFCRLQCSLGTDFRWQKWPDPGQKINSRHFTTVCHHWRIHSSTTLATISVCLSQIQNYWHGKGTENRSPACSLPVFPSYFLHHIL